MTFTLTVEGSLPWHLTVSKPDYDYYYSGDPVYSYFNRPPLFLEGESTTSSEVGTNVGAPVLACDPDGDSLRYIALEGADGAAFGLNKETGQLPTKSGVTYNQASYEFNVIVEEQQENGWLSAISVTVNIR